MVWYISLISFLLKRKVERREMIQKEQNNKKLRKYFSLEQQKGKLMESGTGTRAED